MEQTSANNLRPLIEDIRNLAGRSGVTSLYFPVDNVGLSTCCGLVFYAGVEKKMGKIAPGCRQPHGKDALTGGCKTI